MGVLAPDRGGGAPLADVPGRIVGAVLVAEAVTFWEVRGGPAGVFDRGGNALGVFDLGGGALASASAI